MLALAPSGSAELGSAHRTLRKPKPPRKTPSAPERATLVPRASRSSRRLGFQTAIPATRKPSLLAARVKPVVIGEAVGVVRSEHVDGLQAELPREQGVCGSLEVIRCFDPSVIADAGRVVDARRTSCSSSSACVKSGLVFCALIIASDARFEIGISTAAQSDVYGPITATRLWSAAYRFAFDMHFAWSAKPA